MAEQTLERLNHVALATTNKCATLQLPVLCLCLWSCVWFISGWRRLVWSTHSMHITYPGCMHSLCEQCTVGWVSLFPAPGTLWYCARASCTILPFSAAHAWIEHIFIWCGQLDHNAFASWLLVWKFSVFIINICAFNNGGRQTVFIWRDREREIGWIVAPCITGKDYHSSGWFIGWSLLRKAI